MQRVHVGLSENLDTLCTLPYTPTMPFSLSRRLRQKCLGVNAPHLVHRDPQQLQSLDTAAPFLSRCLRAVPSHRPSRTHQLGAWRKFSVREDCKATTILSAISKDFRRLLSQQLGDERTSRRPIFAA
jgi:hypothetical protein